MKRHRAHVRGRRPRVAVVVEAELWRNLSNRFDTMETRINAAVAEVSTRVDNLTRNMAAIDAEFRSRLRTSGDPTADKTLRTLVHRVHDMAKDLADYFGLDDMEKDT